MRGERGGGESGEGEGGRAEVDFVPMLLAALKVLCSCWKKRRKGGRERESVCVRERDEREREKVSKFQKKTKSKSNASKKEWTITYVLSYVHPIAKAAHINGLQEEKLRRDMVREERRWESVRVSVYVRVCEREKRERKVREKEGWAATSSAAVHEVVKRGKSILSVEHVSADEMKDAYMNTYTHIHTHIHTYTHTYIHIHTHPLTHIRERTHT